MMPEKRESLMRYVRSTSSPFYPFPVPHDLLSQEQQDTYRLAAIEHYLEHLTMGDQLECVMEVYDQLRRASTPLALEELLRAWDLGIARPSYDVLPLLLSVAIDAGSLMQDAFGRYFCASPAELLHKTSLPPSLRFAILKRDQYRCRLCGISPENTPGTILEVDHITPRIKGGTDDPINLWTLCFACNRGKGIQEL